MLEAVYNRLPIWAQHLAVSAYGWHLQRLRYGGQFERRLAWWGKLQQLSCEERDILLTTRLRSILRIAIEQTPYGKQLSERHAISADGICHWTDLRHLPILEKDTVRANPDLFFNRALSAREVSYDHTSGTTGSPLHIAVSIEALRDCYALVNVAKGWGGIGHNARKATFSGKLTVPVRQSAPPYWRYNKPGRQLVFSVHHISPDSVPDYAERLNEYQPQDLDGFPSAIYSVARMSLAQGLRLPQPIAIRTWGEKLYDFQREVIETAFNAPIFDWYGVAENCCYAAECEYGNYHVFDDFGIVEVLENGKPVKAGEEGDIVATALSNRAMPLIRYRVGDRAVLGPAECGCGNHSTILTSITGRCDDMVITPSGRIMGNVLDLSLSVFPQIAEAQIVQNSVEGICVKLVPHGTFGSSQREALKAKLRQRLGSEIGIELRVVDEIPRTQAGKYKLVESTLDVEDYLAHGARRLAS